MVNRCDRQPPEERARMVAIIREMYPWHSQTAIMTMLPGYTWSGIRTMAYRLGVTRMVGRWTLPIDDQIEEEGDQPYGTIEPGSIAP